MKKIWSWLIGGFVKRVAVIGLGGVLGIFLCFLSFAEEPSTVIEEPSAVMEKSSAVMEKSSALVEEPSVIAGEFQQDLILKDVNQILQSKGRFVFDSKQGILLQYKEPFAYYRFFHGHQIVSFDPEGHMQNIEKLPNGYDINGMMEYFLKKGNIQQNRDGQIDNIFTIEEIKAGHWILHPKSAELKQIMKQISISETKKERKISIDKANDDREDWVFTFSDEASVFSEKEQNMIKNYED